MPQPSASRNHSSFPCSRVGTHTPVIPAYAGIQKPQQTALQMDSGIRQNDGRAFPLPSFPCSRVGTHTPVIPAYAGIQKPQQTVSQIDFGIRQNDGKGFSLIPMLVRGNAHPLSSRRMPGSRNLNRSRTGAGQGQVFDLHRAGCTGQGQVFTGQGQVFDLWSIVVEAVPTEPVTLRFAKSSAKRGQYRMALT